MQENNSSPWGGNERRGAQGAPTLQDLMVRLDNHYRDEARSMMEFTTRVSSIESDMKIVSESMRKMSDVLERLALAEERDKSRHEQITQIKHNHEELAAKVDRIRDYSSETHSVMDNMPGTEEFYALKDVVNKWIYIGTGVGLCFALIGAVLGSYLNSKLLEFDGTIGQMKTHMAVDVPSGWPQQSLPQSLPPQQGPNK